MQTKSTTKSQIYICNNNKQEQHSPKKSKERERGRNINSAKQKQEQEQTEEVNSSDLWSNSRLMASAAESTQENV